MTTVTQPLEISVLAAPLEAIDRRAISQAWYAALGLARRGSGDVAMPRPPRCGAPSSNPLSTVLSARSAVEGRHKSALLKERSFEIRIRRSPKRLEFLRLERRNDLRAPTAPRAETSALAARIGRKLEVCSKRATIQLEGEHGRVHLMLQKVGARTRVIAICPKRVEARVARALDEARYALALWGVLTESSVKGVRSWK